MHSFDGDDFTEMPVASSSSGVQLPLSYDSLAPPPAGSKTARSSGSWLESTGHGSVADVWLAADSHSHLGATTDNDGASVRSRDSFVTSVNEKTLLRRSAASDLSWSEDDEKDRSMKACIKRHPRRSIALAVILVALATILGLVLGLQRSDVPSEEKAKSQAAGSPGVSTAVVTSDGKTITLTMDDQGNTATALGSFDRTAASLSAATETAPSLSATESLTSLFGARRCVSLHFRYPTDVRTAPRYRLLYRQVSSQSHNHLR